MEKSKLILVIPLLVLILGFLTLSSVFGQDSDNKQPTLDPSLIKFVQEFDAAIEVQLIGTLAGLSLAAATFLVSVKDSLEEKLDGNKKIKNDLSDRNLSISQDLKDRIKNLDCKIVIVEQGSKYLFKAFFAFIINTVSVLLVFDTVLKNQVVSSVIDVAVSVLGEGVPFFVGIACLVGGAVYIRNLFT